MNTSTYREYIGMTDNMINAMLADLEYRYENAPIAEQKIILEEMGRLRERLKNGNNN